MKQDEPHYTFKMDLDEHKIETSGETRIEFLQNLVDTLHLAIEKEIEWEEEQRKLLYSQDNTELL